VALAIEKKNTLRLSLSCLLCGVLITDPLTAGDNPLLRSYREGEKLIYLMSGVNENWHYRIQADGVVKKDANGTLFEEYGWSHLISDDQKVDLPPASRNFRQHVSLEPARKPSIPNLSQVDPRLIGPITDLLTFYADLWLAEKIGKLTHAGDHFYSSDGNTNSWADGNFVLIGEDAIDFDLTLAEVDRTENTATLIVHHVPPEKSKLDLPAEWTRRPVADTTNNWIQVQKTRNGSYLAAAGKETFDVRIKLSLADGKILSGTMENSVRTIERDCADAALTNCSESRPHTIARHVEISLVH